MLKGKQNRKADNHLHIKAVNRLNEEQITAVRDLIAQCQLKDGTKGTVVLETALNFHQDMPVVFLCYEGESLCGMLRIFAPLPNTAEISAYVLPPKRRQGLFKMLLKRAMETLSAFGYSRVLFVHEHRGRDAAEIIKRWPVQWEHAEYLLVYTGQNATPTKVMPEDLSLRYVEQDDIRDIAALSGLVFGDCGIAETMAQKSYEDPDVLCFCATHQGKLIGVVNARLHEDDASIFGFGISPEYQDKGIGRGFLYHVIDTLRPYGKEITLEVDSNNPRAYHLYTTSGFFIRTQFDYYLCRLCDLPL